MQGYWIELFSPRAANDVKRFLPDNVTFIQNPDSGRLEDILSAARRNEAKVLLECPDAYPGIEFGSEIYADSFKARSVVAGDWFGEKVPPCRILTQHNFVLRVVNSPVKSHLVAARVAGYRDACFGLEDAEKYPLLFEAPDCSNILIAVTPFASFIRSRFAPAADWKTVIGKLLGFLSGSEEILPIDYELSVRPTYKAEEPLPENFEAAAFKRNAEWFYREMIYNHHGDIGVFEGLTSVIDVTGRQWVMPALRGDCMGESSAVGALDCVINGERMGRAMSEGLIKTMLDTPKVRDCCQASQTFGSLFFDESNRSVYGDDNARAALGAILSEELLDDPKHAKKLLQLGYSLLRTTGSNGLRTPSLIHPKHFQDQKTWVYYHENNYEKCHPHYQAFHWALNCQLYALSGDRRFLDSAIAAMEEANRCFPDFYWQNGATGDWCRILLPYAMLVEVDDTPEHRKWLHKVVTFFISKLNKFHTLPELMGKRELGHYPSPACNADHGRGESALVQFNGDPACDLLYSVNYGFIGLHEAVMATGNPEYKAALDGMAEFFCRIQATSTDQSYIDGAWLRGFDYGLWEFFGSASDSGWGPWCVETGWTNAWIATTLALRKLNRPLLCRKHAGVYRELAEGVAQMMFTPIMPSITSRGTTTFVNTALAGGFAEG